MYYDDEEYFVYGNSPEFANEGSALRAASADNPRNQPCPTCGTENVLTPHDVALGYQCDDCADRAENPWLQYQDTKMIDYKKMVEVEVLDALRKYNPKMRLVDAHDIMYNNETLDWDDPVALEYVIECLEDDYDIIYNGLEFELIKRKSIHAND